MFTLLSQAIKEVRNIKVLTKTALVADPATLLSPTSHHQQTVTARGTSIRKPYYSSLLSSLGTPAVAIVSHTHTTFMHAALTVKARRSKEYSQIIARLSNALVMLTAEPIPSFPQSSPFHRVRACVYLCVMRGRRPPGKIFFEIKIVLRVV